MNRSRSILDRLHNTGHNQGSNQKQTENRSQNTTQLVVTLVFNTHKKELFNVYRYAPNLSGLVFADFYFSQLHSISLLLLYYPITVGIQLGLLGPVAVLSLLPDLHQAVTATRNKPRTKRKSLATANRIGEWTEERPLLFYGVPGIEFKFKRTNTYTPTKF